MVVQFRAISQKTTQQAELLFQERAAALRRLAAEKIAEAIVDYSPVDTGTYIMAHAAGSAESAEAASRTSRGKARGRNPRQFKTLALGNLKRSVSSAAVTAGQEIWFRNRAEHAVKVEYEGWPTKEAYHVYAKARAFARIAISEAATELGFRTR